MYSLAIHQDGPFWKIALLTFKEKTPQIVLLKALDIGEMPIEALKKVLHKKPYFVASALSADKILLRELEMDIKGWNNVLSALPFQAEELIPFPKEQTILHPFLDSSAGHSSRVQLVATKQEALETHLSHMHEKGIDPQFVTTTVHALKRWSLFVLPEHPSCFLVYLDKEQGFVILLRDSEVVEFKTFSPDHPGDWQRVKEYFKTKLVEGETLPWVAAGESPWLEGEIEPIAVPESLRKFALSIGIGLESLERDGKSVQWRKEALEPPFLQKKQVKSLLLTLTILLSTSCIFGPLGHFFLRKHNEALFQRAEAALEKIGTPVKRMHCDEMLKLLQMQKDQLYQEKRFGALSPSTTWFLTHLEQACAAIDQATLPSLSSLKYEMDAHGETKLRVEWDCPSKESIRTLKKHLMSMEEIKLVQWKEKDLNLSILLKKS